MHKHPPTPNTNGWRAGRGPLWGSRPNAWRANVLWWGGGYANDSSLYSLY